MQTWLRKRTTKLLVAAILVLLANILAASAFKKHNPTAPPDNTVAVEAAAVSADAPKPLEYVEIIDSCGPTKEEVCVVARTGPGETYPVVLRLRTGMVLLTSGIVENGGQRWYKIAFDEWLRYPERVGNSLYVAAEYTSPILDVGPIELSQNLHASTSKRIVVDLSEQTLYAYDGDTLFTEMRISTGLEFTPTPRGNFRVYKKTPTRYMQGPIPEISDQFYDLPGVPWNLYFTEQGAVIHGAYWHDQFGKPWSHGCVNLSPEDAKTLYRWADIGTLVTVRD